jgi:hypothetical protein
MGRIEAFPRRNDQVDVQRDEFGGQGRQAVGAAIGETAFDIDVLALAIAENAQELCRNLGDGADQAADLVSAAISIPLANFTPLMTFGN